MIDPNISCLFTCNWSFILIQGVEIEVDVLDRDVTASVSGNVTNYQVMDTFTFTYTTPPNWPQEQVVLTGLRNTPLAESKYVSILAIPFLALHPDET